MVNTYRRNPWSTILVMLFSIGLMATWVWLPKQIVEQTRAVERQQMVHWAGDMANQWIVSRSSLAMIDFSKEAEKAADWLNGGREIDSWLLDRIYTTLLWIDVFAYRMYSLVIWGLLVFPLLLAASADGLYVREIRKTMFVSQSPLRLRVGASLFLLTSVLLFVWLFVPVPLPALSAPTMLVLMAYSLWIWMANLQKRI
ncbi:DUF4400 domain-containing protein [Nitrosomonas halophila]|uniref:DUF4400 domain-containing protein n=1 Tax=Nitrosomonas halophila TaxID=44576 RepID=A0A1H3F9P4_9PROT|nr:DUF4400 domain-containing protein [Nitrosomonas halophila]SDX87615.1 protein of unknown function [Nitrosomonas halophila]